MRKNVSILFSTVIGLVTQAFAQTNAPAEAPKAAPSAGAKIVFAEPIHDFGKVESGQPVKYSFIFTNAGTATLEVTEVKPGCGCTTAGEWDKKVEPGKTGTISVQFNSTGYGGSVAKFIAVKCNDAAQPAPTLQLKGTVWKPIDVAPAYAMFQLPPDGQKRETKVVKITSNLDEPLSVSAPTNRNPAFEVEFKTNQVGKEFELAVTVVPPIGEGNISAAYQLTTSSAKMPSLNVVAYAMGQPLLTIMPSQITVPTGPLPTVFESHFTIQNNSTNSLTLSEPGLSIPGIDVQIKEMTPGRQYGVSANFPVGFKMEPGKTAELHMKSNFPKYPTITIPVVQTPPPPPPVMLPPSQAAAPAKS